MKILAACNAVLCIQKQAFYYQHTLPGNLTYRNHKYKSRFQNPSSIQPSDRHNRSAQADYDTSLLTVQVTSILEESIETREYKIKKGEDVHKSERI